MDDYRNTKYCPSFDKLGDRKSELLRLVQMEHKKAQNIYDYVSKRDGYKKDFASVYNYKCAYCGVSVDLLPLDGFEIDHVRYKKSFEKSYEAGCIDNLALSCRYCNRKKSDFPIPDDHMQVLHPDKDITACFDRDDLYNIIIKPDKADDDIVNRFYNQMCLGDEVHRLDFLLMNMIGLSKKIEDKPVVKLHLCEAIATLRKKRNIWLQ